jgi:hypothetical protein
LTRLNGYLVNAVSMTGRNGSTTYSSGANLATYVGSMIVDGSNGQVTCHRSWGQSRRWGIWNAYNRQPILLKAGDSTASWTYGSATVRAANNASANSLTVFCGLGDSIYNVRAEQKLSATVGAGSGNAANGIGWNSVTTVSGRGGYFGVGTGNVVGGNLCAEYQPLPSLGQRCHGA